MSTISQTQDSYVLQRSRLNDHIVNYCEKKPKDIFNIIKHVSEWAEYFFESAGLKNLTTWSKHARSAFAFPNLIVNGNELWKSGFHCIETVRNWWEGRQCEDLNDHFREVAVNSAKVGSDVCELAKFGGKIKAFDINTYFVEGMKSSLGIVVSGNELWDNGRKYFNERASEANASELEVAISDKKSQVTRWEIIKNSFSVLGNSISLAGVITGIAMNSLLILSISSVVLVASIAVFFLKEEIADLQNPPSLANHTITQF